ncbi:MAG: BACON domain-containing protein [Tidjanibacter sp.]|nr:BACON domain-containing protein [Tidjanibacter sp.]
MKRFLTFMMVLGALLMSACNEPDATENSALSITSVTSIFEAEGGDGIIAYSIQNPVAGVQVIAKCDAEWVDGLTTGDAVTFTVLPNTTGALRSAKITLHYGTKNAVEVGISQKAGSGNAGGNDDDNNGGGNDEGGNNGGTGDTVESILSYCIADYYGTDYSSTYNYFVIISNATVDEEGYLPEDAVAYCFDLYSNTSWSACGGGVPTGTYTFDASDSTAANTLGNEYSYCYPADGGEYGFTAGSVKVSSNRIEATVTLTNGEVHHIVYNGSIYSDDFSEGGSDEGGSDEGGSDDYYAYSNLTSNYSLNLSGSNAVMDIYSYGDYYGVGCNNYWIDIYEDGSTLSGVYLSLDLLTDSSADALSGTYTASYGVTSSYEKTYVEGGIDEEGYLYGSWLCTLVAGEFADSSIYSPIYEGTITLSKSGDKYTVTYNCTDDAGYKITGTATASYTTYDYSDEYSAPAKSAKKASVVKRAKAVKRASFKKVVRR